jgi:cell division protein FtsZ
MDFSWEEYETVGDAIKEFASEDSQTIIGVTIDQTDDSGNLQGQEMACSTAASARSSPLAIPIPITAVVPASTPESCLPSPRLTT